MGALAKLVEVGAMSMVHQCSKQTVGFFGCFFP